MRYVPGNAQHIGSRQQQEDSFGFSDLENSALVFHGGFVAAVADGMGGLAHGRDASQAGIRTFLESYARKPQDEEVPLAMERAMLDANEAVIQVGKQMGTPGDVGSTLVAIALRGLSLYWISVGDSGLYLWRNGQLTWLNNTHTYANELDRKAAEGEISLHQAQQDPDREALTSYLGQHPLKEMDRNVKAFPLQAGDQVLLCTDGVFKTLTGEQMNDAMETIPQRSCERMLQQALAINKQHQDNLTVLSVGIEKEAAFASSAVTKASAANKVAPSRRRGKYLLGVVAGVAVIAVLWLTVRFWRFRHPAPASQPVSQKIVPASGGVKVTPLTTVDSEKPHERSNAKPDAAKKAGPKQTSNSKANP